MLRTERKPVSPLHREQGIVYTDENKSEECKCRINQLANEPLVNEDSDNGEEHALFEIPVEIEARGTHREKATCVIPYRKTSEI